MPTFHEDGYKHSAKFGDNHKDSLHKPFRGLYRLQPTSIQLHAQRGLGPLTGAAFWCAPTDLHGPGYARAPLRCRTWQRWGGSSGSDGMTNPGRVADATDALCGK